MGLLSSYGPMTFQSIEEVRPKRLKESFDYDKIKSAVKARHPDEAGESDKADMIKVQNEYKLSHKGSENVFMEHEHENSKIYINQHFSPKKEFKDMGESIRSSIRSSRRFSAELDAQYELELEEFIQEFKKLKIVPKVLKAWYEMVRVKKSEVMSVSAKSMYSLKHKKQTASRKKMKRARNPIY